MTTESLQTSILLVEDDNKIFNEIKTLMSFMGFEISYTHDLSSLDTTLKNNHYTAVLLGRCHGASDQKQALDILHGNTSKPELYPMLGVEEPDAKDSASVRYILKNSQGTALADLIVGEGKPAKGDATASEYFIRETGQAQSWLVQGRLPRDADTLSDWLQGRIAAISSDRIYQVEVTHPDGEVVTVRKEKPGDGSFRFVEAPEGVEIKDQWRLNDIGRVLADLSLEDVLDADAAAGRFGENDRVVEVHSFDGLVVRMQIADLGEDEHLARLSASFDPEQAAAGAALESSLLHDAAALRKEVEELNQNWQQWVYRIPRYKADYVSKTAIDLLPKAESPGEQDPLPTPKS